MTAQGLAAELSADVTARSLSIIGDFADRLCQTVPLTTASNTIELSGTAKAEIQGLIKKLADLGVSAAAKYQTVSSRNVLQVDLAKVLNESRECRMQVWRDLKGTFKISSLIPTGNFTQPNTTERLPNLWGLSYWNSTSETFDTQVRACVGTKIRTQTLTFAPRSEQNKLSGKLMISYLERRTYTGPAVIVSSNAIEGEIASQSYRDCLRGARSQSIDSIANYSAVVELRMSGAGLVYDENELTRSTNFPTEIRSGSPFRFGTVTLLASNGYVKLDNEAALELGTPK